MIAYENCNGESGVIGYEIGDGYIRVYFETGGIYLYTYHKPGGPQVEAMISLAKAGSGLNTYINKSIRKNYDTKER